MDVKRRQITQCVTAVTASNKKPTNKKKWLRENVAIFFVQNCNADLMCGFIWIWLDANIQE